MNLVGAWDSGLDRHLAVGGLPRQSSRSKAGSGHPGLGPAPLMPTRSTGLVPPHNAPQVAVTWKKKVLLSQH